jgi:hypothetical protein
MKRPAAWLDCLGSKANRGPVARPGFISSKAGKRLATRPGCLGSKARKWPATWTSRVSSEVDERTVTSIVGLTKGLLLSSAVSPLASGDLATSLQLAAAFDFGSSRVSTLASTLQSTTLADLSQLRELRSLQPQPRRWM